MDFQLILSIAIIVLTAILSRLPFLRFPMDDDFSIYTYIARFADRGLRWKKDLFLVGLPIWRMLILDKLYGRPETGVQRTRAFFAAVHTASALVIFYCAHSLTSNLPAAFIAGLLYAFYGSSIDYTAGNYSPEQRYIPLVFLGLALLMKGPETVLYAGLFFGLASALFWKPGVFPAVLMWAVWHRYGFEALCLFTASAALPVFLALLVDWKLGYLDAESRKQYAARAATSLRLVRTKSMYFSIPREIFRLMGQTLPVWVVGLPATFYACLGDKGTWAAAFVGTIVILLLIQRGFSRYHYQPLVAWLALATGWGIDRLMRMGGPWETAAFAALAAALIGNLIYTLPFYLKPADVKNLNRHEKFDQYIYLPHVGKILKRLMRMRGETGRRIFVWGTFTQLYHLTGSPAADTYLHHCVGPWDSPTLEPYFDSVVGGLVRHKPLYLIKAFHDLDVDRLEQATGLKYQLLKIVLVRFPVYRLVSLQPPSPDPLSLPWREKMRLMRYLTEKDEEPQREKTDCEGKHRPGINKTDLKSGRIQTALKECRKLCKLNPYDRDGLYFLGKLYDWARRVRESAATFGHLLQLEPGHRYVRTILAKQQINQDNLDAAEQLIREDIRLFGERHEHYFYLGRICQKRGQQREAAGYFEKICSENAEWIDARFYLAESLTALDRRDEARTLYADAFDEIGEQFDADWLQTKSATGVARLDAGQRPESETLESYYHRAPKNEILAYAWASALEREGKTEKARSLFETFAASFEKKHLRANAWFRLARLSDGERRQRSLSECLKLDPGHAGAQKLLSEFTRKPEPANRAL
ncbi:MAG: hypothetical protein HY579_05345 [Nitrospinae bacterium]|nr:hypothetical protein [Nitrospinota bacterium]